MSVQTAKLTVPEKTAGELREVLEATMREYDVDYICLKEEGAPVPFGVVMPYHTFKALREAAHG